MNRSLALCLLLVILGGAACTQPPQRTPVAGLPHPHAWIANPAPHQPDLDAWWTLFGHPELNRTVQEALQANLDLHQAIARLEAAAAQARIVGAPLSPQLDLQTASQRQQQVFVGLPIPGRESEPLTSRSTAHRLSFNLSWELDLWGRLRAGQQAALAEVQASEEDFRAALLSVAGQTVKLWFALVEGHGQLNLARATAQSFGLTSSQVNQRYQRGLRSALDLRLARFNEAAANALVSQRQRELETLTRQLEILLGRYPAGQVTVPNALPDLPKPLPAGLPSTLLERRSDLLAAERRLAASLARVHEAKAALLPRISLTASGGRTSAELEDLLSNQFTMWSLAGNLAQPILQGGRLQANLALSEARAREAVDLYRAAALRAFGEVETTLAAEQWLAQRETDLADAIEHAQAALQLAQDRYRLGLIDFVTLMETQRAAFNAQSQFLLVRRQRLDNRVDLCLALGGGFPAHSSPRLAQAQTPASSHPQATHHSPQ